MISVKKSYLRKLGLAAVVTGVIMAALASAASAGGSSVAITSPSLGNVHLFVDANSNHTEDAGEAVGDFPSYQGSSLSFKWAPYAFPAGVNGSYYITLWQNTTPLAEKPTWVMRKSAHDFADNPAGTEYTMGPFFSYEGLCEMCPTMLVVELEVYQYSNGDVLYFPYSASLTDGTAPSGFATSDEFVLRALPGHESNPGPSCSDPDESEACCNKAGGSWGGPEEGCFLGPD